MALLEELDQSRTLSDLGPIEVTGSYVSGLMCWRDLDVGLLVGPGCGPRDVLRWITKLLDFPGVAGFDYRDERADRSPTGLAKEERYHVVVLVDRAAGTWRLDLSLWLHDIHTNVTDWHRSLLSTLTDGQRAAILRIKDVWHRLPSYPDQVGGYEIYNAVIEDGIRTPDQFRDWLAARGSPDT
ncbi:MAG: hypothetical protein ABWZ82_01155 [Candidatus Limnocylindrales bacterium]